MYVHALCAVCLLFVCLFVVDAMMAVPAQGMKTWQFESNKSERAAAVIVQQSLPIASQHKSVNTESATEKHQQRQTPTHWDSVEPAIWTSYWTLLARQWLAITVLCGTWLFVVIASILKSGNGGIGSFECCRSSVCC
jgi:hypothetical protein